MTSSSADSSPTLSARTEYVDTAPGKRMAYRRIGAARDGLPPLMMHIHFRANMDFWDPLLLDSLAAHRQVIIFDQPGTGRSSGPVAATFHDWADNVLALATALALPQIDLFGFSMGGPAVQMAALAAPQLVRKLVLAGTTASTPGPASDIDGILWPRDVAPAAPIKVLASAPADDLAAVQHALAFSFFSATDRGRAAASAYWARISALAPAAMRSSEARAPLLRFLDAAGSRRQRAAFAEWSAHNAANSYDRLHELAMPVLVMNGERDELIPTSRSWELSRKIGDAQLIVYPQSGHGFLWQYAPLVAEHVNLFLGKGDKNCARL
ncbi:hypothetical protein MBLNU459_g4720t1 [Dothideomycetes sp. NU459]